MPGTVLDIYIYIYIYIERERERERERSSTVPGIKHILSIASFSLGYIYPNENDAMDSIGPLLMY